jgi:hypothetical protein
VVRRACLSGGLGIAQLLELPQLFGGEISEQGLKLVRWRALVRGGHELEAVGEPQDDTYVAFSNLLLDRGMQGLVEPGQEGVAAGARILDPALKDWIVVAPPGKLTARATDLIGGGGDGLPRGEELGRAMPVDPTEPGTPDPGCGCTGHWTVSEGRDPGEADAERVAWSGCSEPIGKRT